MIDQPSQQPTLLFLVTEDWYFASHRLPLARAAIANGYRVVVATRVERHGEVIRAAGCELVPLRWRRRAGAPWREAANLLEVIALYRRLRPVIVHHVALKPIVYGSIAARVTGVRRVVNAFAGLGYVFTAHTLKARLMRPILRQLLSFTVNLSQSSVTVQNPDDRDMLVKGAIATPRQVTLIRGAGVDLAAFPPQPLSAGVPVVILAARMLWEKGVGEFVAAAHRLQSRGIAARFALVGDTDPENPGAIPARQLSEWNRSGSIEWWGRSEDMPKVFARSRIVCLPSAYGEGVPKVLLEAAASARAIVTTDAPGCREVVRHQFNGLLVGIRDVVGLENALASLIESPELCDRMGRNSRQLAEAEFSVDRVAAETLKLYSRLISSDAEYQ
jgi:glycosyltransferase involved in cell wall biosynthesis